MSGQLAVSILYILAGIALGSIALFLLRVWRRDVLEDQAGRVGLAAVVIPPITVIPLGTHLATHIDATWYAQGVFYVGAIAIAIPAYLLPESRIRRGR